MYGTWFAFQARMIIQDLLAVRKPRSRVEALAHACSVFERILWLALLASTVLLFHAERHVLNADSSHNMVFHYTDCTLHSFVFDGVNPTVVYRLGFPTDIVDE